MKNCCYIRPNTRRVAFLSQTMVIPVYRSCSQRSDFSPCYFSFCALQVAFFFYIPPTWLCLIKLCSKLLPQLLGLLITLDLGWFKSILVQYKTVIDFFLFVCFFKIKHVLLNIVCFHFQCVYLDLNLQRCVTAEEHFSID